MKSLFVFVLTVFLTIASLADPYPRQAIDVRHYRFRIELNDTTNIIGGEASIAIQFNKAMGSFYLDLGSVLTNGTGMTVSKVRMNGTDLTYAHSNGKLTLQLPTTVAAGDTRTFEIQYAGIPEDGLIIGKNKFGDRTFFADHWPDRGHLWLPCIDHPSDKSTVEFVIVAPEYYQVVASGRLVEESNMDRHRKLTRYSEEVPIPVKVMAVGVARFAMEVSAVIDNIPQSTWVYPQNRDDGFSDFKVSVNVFDYFHRSIGPYSYEKLAHVQSKTRWGGLENAGNIFYRESAVNGKGTIEKLIAHETAHQWFGNSVAEKDWHHVWVSEGFATYFALLYLEHTYGPERLAADLATDRQNVLKYYQKNPKPIVDTTITEIGKVLSTNTYQKASWVLHMLRQRIGDENFWKGIRTYYKTYQNTNVLSADFQKIMEQASGQDLGAFFRQWLYQAGHPNFNLNWTYNKARSEVIVTIQQKEPRFDFPLDIRFRIPDGAPVDRTVTVNGAEVKISLPVPAKPTGVELDPGTRLLFEGVVQGR